MHNVTVDFRYIRGLTLSPENDQKVSRVQNALRNLLLSNDAGSMGGRSTGNAGTAFIGMTVHDQAFIENEIIQRLNDLGVLNEVEVYYADESGKEIKIHPREE